MLAVQLAVLGWLMRGAAYPTIDASAGAFGALVAYALLFPERRVVLLFPPVPMPAWLFATGYAALELVLGISGNAPDVAHFAHLGDMAAVLVLYWSHGGPYVKFHDRKVATGHEASAIIAPGARAPAKVCTRVSPQAAG